MRKKSVFNDEQSFLSSWYNLTKGFGEFFKSESEGLEINPAEAMFLSLIYYKDGISQREIANKLLVSEANITKTFKKLERKELTYKTIDDENKARRNLHLTEKGEKTFERNLHLTEKGEKTFEKCIKIFDKFDSILFEGLNDEERAKMLEQMKRVGDKSIRLAKK